MPMTQQEFDATLRTLSTNYAEALAGGETPPPLPQPGEGMEYFISPDGDDGNDGTEAYPWASPDHLVNAGDILTALDGDYDAKVFGPNYWGPVTVPEGSDIHFALLRAKNPFKCTITSANACMRVDASNWAISGFVGQNTADNDGTFVATPSGPYVLHHVLFTNCISLGGYRNGFSIYGYWGDKNFGFDYCGVVGCIAFNSAQGYALCHSGISMYQPTLLDNAPGTHLYIAGNFVFGNVTPGSGCGNGANSDGNGIILDNFSLSQKDGEAPGYAGQTVIEYNMALGNGWAGITVFQCNAGTILICNNTLYGNLVSTINNEYYAGDLMSNDIETCDLSLFNNIAQCNKATIPSNPQYKAYASFIGQADARTIVKGNVLFGLSGQHQKASDCDGFAFGSNANVDPEFTDPAIPTSVPTTEGKKTTVEVMFNMIMDFTPNAPETNGKGYLKDDETDASADFPTWLKGVIPAGLIPLPEGYAEGGW